MNYNNVKKIIGLVGLLFYTFFKCCEHFNLKRFFKIMFVEWKILLSVTFYFCYKVENPLRNLIMNNYILRNNNNKTITTK